MLQLIVFLTWIFIISSQNAYKEDYYDQYIDHFNFYSYKDLKFKQRYLYDDEYLHMQRGPLLFYTGNEGDIESFWNNTGFVFDIAQLLGGLIVFGEHRFYGKSIPLGNNSFNQSHIGLLSIDQALADFAELIRYIFAKFKLSPVTPVITFGGSYGGILSAYMRFKYPNVVDGAIASSAPLLSVANLTPRDFFFKAITKVFNDTSIDCVKNIIAGFNLIKDSKDDVKKTFKLCQELKTKGDKDQFTGWIRNAFVLIAMLNYPYDTNFITNLPKNPVKVACDYMVQASSPTIGLYQIASLVYNNTDSGKVCNDVYKEYVACADPTGCGTGDEGKAWDFQSCTDFILPAGTDNVTDMFPPLPFTLADRDAYCMNRWNVKPRNDRLQLMFWGSGIESSSNIVFTNGDLDPWTPGGILKNVSKSLVSLIVNGGAHHLDLRGARENDIPSVVKVRQAELTYIQGWINETLTEGRNKFQNATLYKSELEREMIDVPAVPRTLSKLDDGMGLTYGLDDIDRNDIAFD